MAKVFRMANGMTISSGDELHAHDRVPGNGGSPRPRGGVVLVVGDVSSDTVRATEALESLAPTTLASAPEALAALSRVHVDVIVADERVGGEKSGYEFLHQAATIQPSAIRVLLEGDGRLVGVRNGADMAVLPKPIDEAALRALCSVALRCAAAQRATRDLEDENDRLRGCETEPVASALDELAQVEYYEGILSRSSAMKRVFRALRKIEETDTAVLICGESGAGKEVVARAIHARSRRASGRFVTVEFGGLSDAVRDGVLFGHVRGAFDGATQSRNGLFVDANGGSVFLDEVSEASPALQVALLRVLEEGIITPVGAAKSRSVDVRVIAGTNRNLPELVRTGCFRQDLYYRLSVFPVEIPPLREHPEDILPLAGHFFASACFALGKKPPSISREARCALEAHQWEGNVRELRSVMDRAAVLCKGSLLVAADLPLPPGPKRIDGSGSQGALTVTIPPAGATLEEIERAIFLKTLMLANGNQSRAARILGLRESTLRFRLRKLGIASRRVRSAGSQSPVSG